MDAQPSSLPSSSLLLSSLELSETQVYEPGIRALLGTTSYFWPVVVLQLPSSLPRQQLRFPHGGV